MLYMYFTHNQRQRTNWLYITGSLLHHSMFSLQWMTPGMRESPLLFTIHRKGSFRCQSDTPLDLFHSLRSWNPACVCAFIWILCHTVNFEIVGRPYTQFLCWNGYKQDKCPALISFTVWLIYSKVSNNPRHWLFIMVL